MIIKEVKVVLNKNIFYKRFWLFAVWFTSFWILYGCLDFARKLLLKDSFDIQPIYLIIGMSILLFKSKNEYRKENENGNIDSGLSDK